MLLLHVGPSDYCWILRVSLSPLITSIVSLRPLLLSWNWMSTLSLFIIIELSSSLTLSNFQHHGIDDQTPSPWERTRPPYRRLTTLLGMSIHIYHTGEVFSSLTSSFTFHFHDMLTRALYNKHRHRYRYLPADRIPIFLDRKSVV